MYFNSLNDVVDGFIRKYFRRFFHDSLIGYGSTRLDNRVVCFKTSRRAQKLAPYALSYIKKPYMDISFVCLEYRT